MPLAKFRAMRKALEAALSSMANHAALFRGVVDKPALARLGLSPRASMWLRLAARVDPVCVCTTTTPPSGRADYVPAALRRP